MKNVRLLFWIITTALFAGCVSTQMPEDYTVEPNPLEVHGNTVEVTVSGTIPERSFHRRATVELYPVLRYANQELKLEPIKMRGEKAEGEGIIVPTKEGRRIELSDSFQWEPEMKVADLYVNATVTRRNKSEVIQNIKIADGIIMTPKRVAKTAEPAIADHGYEEETIITQTGNIYYAYNRHNLNWSLPLNRDNKEEMEQLKAFMEKGWDIHMIQIDAWASPEGELTLNQELSENRGETAENYIINWYKRESRKRDNNINYKDVEKDIVIVTEAKGEDFDGFMKALNASDIQEKSTIENVIKSQATRAEREQRIKDMTVIYEEIEEMLEVLRRAEITVHAYEPKRTEQEIARLATTYPDSLTREELLFAATLTENKETKLNIYKATTQAYSDHWAGFNNAAAILLKMGREDEAARYLEQANNLKPNDPHVANNLGVLAAWKKDYASATNYYTTANQAGLNTSYNEGVVQIVNGNYDAAVTSFQEVTCDYNKALALLMAGNISEATKVLDCAEQSAEKHYLLAIIGARSNNANMVYSNLRRAVDLNPEMKKEALVDREFIDYLGRSEFVEIVE